MYKFITILMWIALMAIPFIKPFLFQGNDSIQTYIRDLKKSLLTTWIAYYIDGVEDTGETILFIVSLLSYAFIGAIASLFWIVLLPIILLILLTKKLLKKKS